MYFKNRTINIWRKKRLLIDTRKTDLKPMPFFPMYPALWSFFVEFPISQSALMSLAEKPCSLFSTIMPFSWRMNVSVGSTSGYVLSSAFWTYKPIPEESKIVSDIIQLGITMIILWTTKQRLHYFLAENSETPTYHSNSTEWYSNNKISMFSNSIQPASGISILNALACAFEFSRWINIYVWMHTTCPLSCKLRRSQSSFPPSSLRVDYSVQIVRFFPQCKLNRWYMSKLLCKWMFSIWTYGLSPYTIIITLFGKCFYLS